MNAGDMVLKYPVTIGGSFTHRMPVGAEILTVQSQRSIPQMWARVSGDFEEGEYDTRTFAVVGTGPGHTPLDERFEYVGTWQQAGGDLVWHLFEVKSFADA